MDVARLRGHRRHHSISSSSSFLWLVPESARPRAAEPSSPKVGCTGQIRIGRSKTTSRAAPDPGATRHDRSTLLDLTMRIFSRRRRRSPGERQAAGKTAAEEKKVGSFADLDPPLPVARQAERSCKPAARLWNRRCGGESSLGPLEVGLHAQRMQQWRRQCVSGV